MAPKVERLIENVTTHLGEGPHWDAASQSLYFVDIFGKSIHKYVPSTKQHTSAVIGMIKMLKRRFPKKKLQGSMTYLSSYQSKGKKKSS